IMVAHHLSLSERDRRLNASLEALKLGYGGKQYICKLFKTTFNTIRKGIKELKDRDLYSLVPPDRERKVGGGRKKFCP
ncbi:MAG: hypothetical protein ACRCSB_05635, partial [Bacteroidales bacterium]